MSIYALSSLLPSLISLPPNSLELLLCTVKLHNRLLYIGSYYNPPSSSYSIPSLISLLTCLNHSIITKLTLVGDFNVNYSPSSSSSFFQSLKEMENTFYMSQIITDPTHFSPSGSPSMIDLAFVPTSYNWSYDVLPPISSSDHNSVLLSVSPRSFYHSLPKSFRQ